MLKLKLKKWIGSWFGIWCPECGEKMETVGYIGYNDVDKCLNPHCIVNKRRRGRPKKSKL